MGKGSANIIYFGYGSNMCPEQMAMRCPGGHAVGRAELRDWRFLINIRTYATIESKPGAATHGVLWSLTPGHITELDHYEAVAEGMYFCLLYTSPSPRDATLSRMPSSA